VHQVFDELRRWPTIQSQFTPHKKRFLIENQYRNEISVIVGPIAEDFPFLFDLTGSKNPDPTDPWLIAAAKVLGWTVVTDERQLIRLPPAKPSGAVYRRTRVLFGGRNCLGRSSPSLSRPRHHEDDLARSRRVIGEAGGTARARQHSERHRGRALG
jgi:hypothetical protein